MLSSGSYSISGAVYSCRAAPEGTAARSTGLLLRTAGNSRKGHARKQLPAKAVATSTSRSTLLLLEPSICFYHSTPTPNSTQALPKIQGCRGRGSDDIWGYSSPSPTLQHGPWTSQEADSFSTQLHSAFLPIWRSTFWPFIVVAFSNLPLLIRSTLSYYLGGSWRTCSDEEGKTH